MCQEERPEVVCCQCDLEPFWSLFVLRHEYSSIVNEAVKLLIVSQEAISKLLNGPTIRMHVKAAILMMGHFRKASVKPCAGMSALHVATDLNDSKSICLNLTWLPGTARKISATALHFIACCCSSTLSLCTAVQVRLLLVDIGQYLWPLSSFLLARTTDALFWASFLAA